ncbi:MAG: DUF1016 family protein [Pirellulales bacterium]|nr:DUF1016 family protein [Pirellulales bacterium]
MNGYLWSLDALWYGIKSNNGCEEANNEQEIEEANNEQEIVVNSETSQTFGLERHLHDFLYDNWDVLSIGKEWDLYEVDGDIVGYEYDTKAIGKIDLLAHHKTEGRWLVVELKREQASDDTVGQVLRYMGWVKEHLATERNENVEGMIIARHSNERLRYALMYALGVTLKTYTVDFQLCNDSAEGGAT